MSQETETETKNDSSKPPQLLKALIAKSWSNKS